MNGPTHGAAGVAVGSIIIAVTAPRIDVAAVGMIVSIHAALFPDFLQVSYPLINIVGFEGHRGFSHWILTAVLISMWINGSYPQLAPYWLWGHLSHILFDSFTFVGIPAFGPYPKRINILNQQNGGKFDSWLGRMCMFIASVCSIFIVCR